MNRFRKYSVHARRFARDERGSPAVEFALIMFFVLTPLFLGIVQFGSAFYTYNEMMNGAREGARRMAVGVSGEMVKPTVLAAMVLHQGEHVLCMEDAEVAIDPPCLAETLPSESVRATVQIPLSKAMVLGLPTGIDDRTLTASVTMYKE